MSRALLLHNMTSVGLALLGLAGLLAALHLIEASVGRYIAKRWGWNGVLVTAWIGVPIHELSHLFFAWIFGHRIVAWKLFDPDPTNGTLGYVRHAYSRRTLVQLVGDFFIAVAPVVGGSLALIALVASIITPRGLLELVQKVVAAGPSDGVATARLALRSLFESIVDHRSAWLPLQLYACAAVAAHMAPSKQDFGSAKLGALMVVLIAIALALTTTVVGVAATRVTLLLVPLAACVVVATVLQLCIVGVVYLTSRD